MPELGQLPAAPPRRRVTRILVIRLSAIGDVVMASGLIPALRNRHPDAYLAWLIEPAARPLLAHNPRLDELVVWPRGEWQQLWRERRLGELWRRVCAFRRMLRAHRFDVVLDAQGLLKSAIWSWLSGAPRRLSLIGHEHSHWLATERVVPPRLPEPRPMGAEYRHLASHLGAPADSFRMDLVVGSEPRERARARLPATRYAVLCPFTTRAQKHWFEDRWQSLATRLRDAGLTPVMLGGPGDRPAAERIAADAPGLLNLVGELKLDESVAAIERAALLIGVDTGLTHMGTALGVPTVALFGSTCPYRDPGMPRSVVLYDPRHCSPCRRHPTCDDRYDCMRDFTVARVFDAAMALQP